MFAFQADLVIEEKYPNMVIPIMEFSMVTISTIRFPENSSIIKIDDYAFSNCHNLKSVYLSRSIAELGNYCFFACNCLKTISFSRHSHLQTIGKGAFENDNSITSFEFPNSLRYIGPYAFFNCKLEFVDLTGTKIEIIGEHAFDNNLMHHEIKQMNLPSSLKCFDQGTISKINDIVVNKAGKYIISDMKGVSYDYTSDGLFNCPKSANKIFIRNDISKILKSACEKASLTQICIPSSIKEIEKFAFYCCRNLKKILFQSPSNVKIIHESAFIECIMIKEINFPASVAEIKQNAFQFCYSLKRVNFPENSKLEKLEDCFYKTSIELLELPRSLKHIKRNIIGSMGVLQSVSISNDLFEYKDMFLIKTVSNKLIGIHQNLNVAVVPDGVRQIGSCAFRWCLVESLFIPKTVEIIKSFAFNSSILNSITFEEGSTLKEIREAAFYYSANIKELNLPPSVRNIHYNAFISRSSIQKVTINNENFQTNEDGVVFGFNPPSIVFCPEHVERLEIPDDIEIIYGSAFQKSKISSLKFPQSLKKICYMAFYKSNIEEFEFHPNTHLEIIESWSITGPIASDVMLPSKIDVIKNYCIECKSLILKNDFECREIEPNCFYNVKNIYGPKNILAKLSVKGKLNLI